VLRETVLSSKSLDPRFSLKILLAPLLLFIAAAPTDTRAIRIIGVDEQNPQSGRVLVPHLPPVIYVRQIAGDKLPTDGSINCHWQQEAGPKLVGTCEDGVKLIVTGIDLNY
jgi:hypothetical protein